MKRLALAVLALTLGLLACARTSPADPKRTLTVDGLERTYLLHVPPSYDGNQPVPLVLVFHGGGGDSTNQWRVSGFNPLADKEGFIVAYPNGTGRLGDKALTWNGGTCCGYALTNSIDDVGFVRTLVADLQTNYQIDPQRIYATGLSNGGIMSYRLACEASDLFAAIGPVAGTLNFQPCDPSEPISVIEFHGTDDQHILYDGGAGPKSLVGVNFTSAQDSVGFWIAFNQCASQPQINSFEDIQHAAWTGCLNSTAVELYTILGGKHAWPGSDGPAWPGGDEPTQSISATNLIWEFFAAHPKP